MSATRQAPRIAACSSPASDRRATCVFGITMTCVGAFGATSWNARTRSSSKTIFAGISFRTIRQKRQEGSASGLTAALSVDPLDGGAEGPEALVHRGISPVEVIDAADARLAPGDEACQDESGGRAEVRSRDGRALEPRRPAHDRRPPLDAHVGAQARELDRVEEAVLEDRLDEAGRPLGLRHQ